MNHSEVVVRVLKEVMAVFERPVRHRPGLRDSGPARRTAGGEAGRRYLKRVPPGLAVVKYVRFTPCKPWESWLVHLNRTYLSTPPVRLIDIALGRYA